MSATVSVALQTYGGELTQPIGNASGKAANGYSPSRDGKATLSLEMSQRPVRPILIRLTSPKVGSAYTCLLPLRTLKWRALVDAPKALHLSQELVENADTFSAKITGYCRSLEEANKLTEAFMDSTMELFRYQVLAVFNQCGVNPQSTMCGTTSSPKQLALTVIFKKTNAWNSDVPRGSAIDMPGALVSGNTRGGSAHQLRYSCGKSRPPSSSGNTRGGSAHQLRYSCGKSRPPSRILPEQR
jgi:hypothetical protein